MIEIALMFGIILFMSLPFGIIYYVLNALQDRKMVKMILEHEASLTEQLNIQQLILCRAVDRAWQKPREVKTNN